MAETSNVTEMTNAGNRAEVIRNGFAQMIEIDDHIAAMEEKHVKPHKKERTELWRTMKADTNIARKIMESQYKQYKLLHEARCSDADGDFDKVLDDLREVFEALHPGGQLDWIAALQGDGAGQMPAAE